MSHLRFGVEMPRLWEPSVLVGSLFWLRGEVELGCNYWKKRRKSRLKSASFVFSLRGASRA